MKLFLLLIVGIIRASNAYHIQTGYNRMPQNDYSQFFNFNNQQSSGNNVSSVHSNHHFINQLSSRPYSQPSHSDLFNHFARPFDSFHRFQGFLFSCDGLKAGFYSDVYNDCRYFHLCHEPNLKFNYLKQLAITTYSCPDNTYFNQKAIACTRLEDFEMNCVDQVKLFKSTDLDEKNIDKLSNKFKNEKVVSETTKSNDKAFEFNGKSIINENLIKNHPDVVSYLLSTISVDKSNYNEVKTNDKLHDQPYADSPHSGKEETSGMVINDEIVDEKTKKDESVDFIETTFSCDKRPGGYYVDFTLNNDCRVFHICQQYEDGNKNGHYMSSFRCPGKTVFNQAKMTCTNAKDLSVPCHKQDIFFPFSNSKGDEDEILDTSMNTEINTDSPIV